MTKEIPDFIQIARECFQQLILCGFEPQESHLCRGEAHLKLRRGKLTIDLGYEPFGPPWCHITDDGKWREVEADTENQAGGALAAGEKRQEFFLTHTDEVRKWCLAVNDTLLADRGIRQ